ncbi:MAG: NAD(P)H-dependent oxidoreductase [Bdellovibrionales bacterium]|nr:NAD(P)H-dependent oxidoreductase [Bdellovibrionales bacterium]
MTSKEIQAALDWRYAVKKFDATRKISPADWKIIEESMVKSPSSYGLQPWKFIVVTDQTLKDQLRPLSWNQSQVSDCSHYVVMLYKKKMDVAFIDRHIHRMAEVRGATLDSLAGFKNSVVGDLINGPRSEVIGPWAQRQVYIAMGFMMTAAALLNIDTCPMEGISPADYDKVLGLENSEWATVATVAVGYRHPEDRFSKLPKVRFRDNEVIEYR